MFQTASGVCNLKANASWLRRVRAYGTHPTQATLAVYQNHPQQIVLAYLNDLLPTLYSLYMDMQ